MSNTSPFTTGTVEDIIGPYGVNDIVDNILNGAATNATLGLPPNNVDKELDVLTHPLQRSMMLDGAPVNNMDGTITLDEYTQLFIKTRKNPHHHPNYIWKTTLYHADM